MFAEDFYYFPSVRLIEGVVPVETIARYRADRRDSVILLLPTVLNSFVVDDAV